MTKCRGVTASNKQPYLQ